MSRQSKHESQNQQQGLLSRYIGHRSARATPLSGAGGLRRHGQASKAKRMQRTFAKWSDRLFELSMLFDQLEFYMSHRAGAAYSMI